MRNRANVAANPVTSIQTKRLCAQSGLLQNGFFESEREALRWLLEAAACQETVSPR